MNLPFDTTTDSRLPQNVKPMHYDLTIRTDLEESVYDGTVIVHLWIVKATSTFVLHSARLDIGNATLIDSNGIEYPEEWNRIDEKQQRVMLSFGVALPENTKALLKVPFQATLADSMDGYYRSPHKEGNQIHYSSLTQFQPTAARKAFPCWDEPSLKATVSVSMISRQGTVNLSNMPVITEQVYQPTTGNTGMVSSHSWSGEWKITSFEKSPPMSTYLIAFSNGKFEYLEGSYTSPISGKTKPLRVYALKTDIEKTQKLLEITIESVPRFERMFDVEYPLPKLDTLTLSACPGAMENWGLITGIASRYLYDPKTGNMDDLKHLYMTQCHEISHQWFGNITTMEWWDNLYLNEAFATLIGSVSLPDKLRPDWKLSTSFIASDLEVALGLDAKLSSHPVEVDCPDDTNLVEIFDEMSYSKGASVLRMLRAYVGEDSFLRGVSLYLKRHLFSNTVTNDLWKAISETSAINITDMMSNWISKTGFPIVTVNEDDEGINVRQDRFLENQLADNGPSTIIWFIPLNILVRSKGGGFIVNRDLVLDTREKKIQVDLSQPFKLNADTVGFYRVLYTPSLRNKVHAEATKHNSVFTIDDRMGLLSDAWAFAKSGHDNLSVALSLVERLRHEKEVLVWEVIAARLADVSSTWYERNAIIGQLNEFIKSLWVPIVDKLGYDYPEDDAADNVLLRTLAITKAADAGDPDVNAKLQQLFERIEQSGDITKIPKELVVPVFSSAIRFGGRREYNFLKQIYENSANSNDRLAALRGMGATEDLTLAQEILDHEPIAMRWENFIRVVVHFRNNRKTRRLLFTWFKENYSTISARFAGTLTWRVILMMCLDSLASDKDHEDVKHFFEENDSFGMESTVLQILENIRARTKWVNRSSMDLEDWLQEWENRRTK